MNGANSDIVTLAEVNIQDVIRERKAERKLQAEGKRQTDLQRIRDMRSTIGIEPLEQFPKEIWLKILDELDPEDRGNIGNVHLLFSDLMESTRVRDILFPRILKLEAFQNITRHSFGSDTFHEQLRLVSKSSCKSFDHWMEDKLRKRVLEIHASSFIYVEDVVQLSLNDHDHVPQLEKKLLSYFKGDNSGNNSGKHFFPRALTVAFAEYGLEDIEDEIPELAEEFKKDVTTLLEGIGDQIWHFRFLMEELEVVEFTFSDVYIMLQNWISLMPNLKWLEIQTGPSYQMIAKSDRKEDVSKAKSALQNYPFPRLKDLERLTLHSSYMPGVSSYNIYDAVLGANQHIKMLDLHDDYEYLADDNDTSGLFPARLTQSLQLTGFTVYDHNQDEELTTLERIQPILNCNWPLQTIIVGLQGHPSGNETVYSVLRYLEKFPTLERVMLKRLHQFSVGASDNLGYLKLPNLKEFELALSSPRIDYDTDTHFFFSLQFMLECKKLERFTWQLDGFLDLQFRRHLQKSEERHGKLLDFRGGLRFLYESSIWDVFPSLEFVRVLMRRGGIDSLCGHTYHREDIGRNMTILQILKVHTCSRHNLLVQCVMLVD